MSEQTTETKAESQQEPDSSGDQLGNILIGAALVMAFILALGFRYAWTSNGSDDPDPRDAEIEFADDRPRDAEVEFAGDRPRDAELDFARDTLLEESERRTEVECEDEFGDGEDAESRFADEPTCVRVSGGLFADEPLRDSDRDDFINFDRLERPTLRADLADRRSSRLREVEVSLGPGRSDVDLAIRNPDSVAQNGDGIAVRTESSAMLLSNDRFATIERPDNCRDGCEFRVWLTMGPNFQELHPDAELLLYAGEDSNAWIDEINSLPNRVYR